MFLRVSRSFFHANPATCFETLNPLIAYPVRRRAEGCIRSRSFNVLGALALVSALACFPASSLAARGRWPYRGGSGLNVSTASLAFGNVSINSPATLSVTLSPSGSTPVTLNAATVTGTGFTASGAALPLSLSAGQTATWVVQFDPTAAGSDSGFLILTTSSGRSAIVALSGTGVADSVATLSVNAGTISFGNVNLNSPSTQSLTLTSTGTAAVTVNSATVSGAGFTLAGASLPFTLAPNQSAALSVQFDPTAAGAAVGALTLTSNSSTGSTTTVSLNGTGVSSGYEVNLAWNAPDSSPDPVSGYNVYRSPSGSNSFQQVNSSSVTQTSYADTGVQNGQAYDYYIESVDASGNSSAPSNTTSVNIP